MPQQPSIKSAYTLTRQQAKHTTGAGTSVVGTASESESESSSSEDSSDELDSGVGSLTTFLDFLDS
jgi:hypothetical protein